MTHITEIDQLDRTTEETLIPRKILAALSGVIGSTQHNHPPLPVIEGLRPDDAFVD